MSDDILDAKAVVRLLPTQRALIRLAKSHEALRARCAELEAERDRGIDGIVVQMRRAEIAEAERDSACDHTDDVVQALQAAEARVAELEAERLGMERERNHATDEYERVCERNRALTEALNTIATMRRSPDGSLSLERRLADLSGEMRSVAARAVLAVHEGETP